MSEPTSKPPISFWIFTAIALIWNLMGVFAFYNQITMSPEALEALPIDQRVLFEAAPAWVTVAFAFAVFGGTLGCLALLLKKAFAYYLFVASLIGILVQMFYNLFMSNSIEVYGPGGFIMPIMVLLIGVALIWYTKKSEKAGWIS